MSKAMTARERSGPRPLGRITLVQRLARAHLAPVPPAPPPAAGVVDGSFAASTGLLHDGVAPAPVRAAARVALLARPKV